jgi:cytochrome c55X
MLFNFQSVFSLFILCLLFYSSVNAQDENISTQRIAELSNLLVQDCGSCHGMTMKGGLGPALTPDILKSKSRE